MTDPTLVTLFRHRATIVWVGFVVATIVSWWLGTHERSSGIVGVMVIGIGCLKARYVGLDFMELRNAPPPLRIVFECWILAVFTLLTVVYQLA